MGYAARLHLAHPVQGMNAEAYQKAEEEANTWWGIIICERTFLCEMDDFQQPFATRIPGSDFEPPTKSEWPIQSTDEPLELPYSDMGGMPTSNCGGFACIAQAAWLLDQVFKTLDIADIHTRYNQLNGLDHTLRATFTIIFDQANGRYGMFCTANSIIIRALLIVHFHILDHTEQMDQSICKSPHDWVKSSRAALKTFTNIVEDIVCIHNALNFPLVDTVPPSSGFYLRSVLRYIHEFKIKGGALEVSEAKLQNALHRQERRWGVST